MREQPGVFPPKIIKKWVSGGTVSTSQLSVELRAWADWAESEEGHG